MLAIIVACLGYAAVTRTIAATLRSGDAERAAALAPGDGRIAGTWAGRLSGPEATMADRTRADRIARGALQHDATAVAAASTLGINAQVRGDMRRARRLFAYAESLSRRDLQTQIWSIEDAVGRGDIAGALRHYDTALRTSRGAASLLFPILGTAIADKPIRDALIATLARRPLWTGIFVEYIATNGPDPRTTAQLFRGLGKAGIAISPLSRSLLVNTLAGRGAFEEAWAYYRTSHPSSDRRRSRDPDFVAADTIPTIFDWTPVSDGSIVTSLQGGRGGGVADFFAPANIGGPMLRQVMLLPPGRYGFDVRGTGIAASRDASPYWTIACADGRELLRAGMAAGGDGLSRFAARFVVPTGCPVQTISLIARPSIELSGTTGQIERAAVYPIS